MPVTASARADYALRGRRGRADRRHAWPAGRGLPADRIWLNGFSVIRQLTDVLRCKLQECFHYWMHTKPPRLKGEPMTGATWSDVKFLTIYELAVMMRISKMSAYRLVRTGELEAIRVGRSYRIPEEAVISYMRDAAFTPTGLAS
jgi:excisionase family DNA binding protein